MNYKLVLVSTLMTSVPIQSAPESPRATSSSSKIQGVLPWIVGTAMLGAGCWAYKSLFPSPEARAQQTATAFRNCLRDNAEGSKNTYRFSPKCEDALITFAVARDALNKKQGTPTTQDILNSFKKQ